MTDRLRNTQISGLETWLARVDPDVQVQMTQLAIDAVQALVEEVHEWRAGALGAGDIAVLRLAAIALRRGRGRPRHPGIALLDRLLAAHGART